ncbi:hypothetical protein Q029_04638 [Pseudomonas aeruginosa BWHPSA016]|nr:hypothetical protein Q029_04638 [Pseudomonas aeruginosa BWHPSA016]
MRGREQRQGIAAERDQDVRHALNGNALPCPHFDPFQGMEETEESPQAPCTDSSISLAEAFR